MDVLNYCAKSLSRVTIPLGRQLDHDVLAITVDVGEWLTEYPDGVIAGYATLPGNDKSYPLSIEMDGDNAVWTVREGDTAKAGYGKFQIALIGADGKKKHSAIADTIILASLSAKAGEAPPDPYKPWMDQVTQDVSGGVRFDKPQELTDEQKKQARKNIGVNESGGTGGVDDEAVKEIVEEALEEAKASGEFDGPQGPEGPAGPAGEAGPQGPVGPKGDRGETGPTGAGGPQGPAGQDGVSPTFSFTRIDGGYRLTIHDATGDHSVVLMDGAQGETGPAGPAGVQGPAGPQGVQGIQGERGAPFSIAKIYDSIEAMNAGYATDGVEIGGFVLIETGDVNDPENATLYVKTETEYSFLTDLSGAQGIQGPQGVQGVQGIQGLQGASGVYVGSEEPADPSVTVWVKPDGEGGSENTPSAQVQSDWNESDSASAAYVQNRTHYTDVQKTLILDVPDLGAVGYYSSEYDRYYLRDSDLVFIEQLKMAYPYLLEINGKVYTANCRLVQAIIFFEDVGLELNNEHDMHRIYDVSVNFPDGLDGVSMKLYRTVSKSIPVDDKYIPDTIPRIEDLAGRYKEERVELWSATITSDSNVNVNDDNGAPIPYVTGEKYVVKIGDNEYRCKGVDGSMLVKLCDENFELIPFYSNYTTRGGNESTNFGLYDASLYGSLVTIYKIVKTAEAIKEEFIPELTGVTIKSSTEGSTKKFRITVDDSGTITATEVQ